MTVKEKVDVSVITVNYNGANDTIEMVNSVMSSDVNNIEIIVVDNASRDSDIQLLRQSYAKSSVVTLVESVKNVGFAGGNNLGIKHARGKYVLFLNNDTIVLKDTIAKLLESLERDSGLGAVSPKIKYHHNPSVVQYAGSTSVDPLTLRNAHVGNRKIDDGRYDQEEDTSYAHGAAMMIPRRVINQVGGMPENYFLYYEELDWCEQIKNAGYRIRYIASSLVYHKESMSVGKDSVMKVYYTTRNRILFARRNFRGWRFALSMLYVFFVSIPKNTIANLASMAKMRAYYGGMLWNLSNGRIATKPF